MGGTHAGETRKDLIDGETVLFCVLRSAGVLDEHERKAEAGTLPRRRFHADVGGDAGKDHGIDPATFELLFQTGAGEGPQWRLVIRMSPAWKPAAGAISDKAAGKGWSPMLCG